MVKVSIQEDKQLYQCEECGFHYTEKEQAEKCEAWCKEHHSCNLEITSQAEESKTDSNNAKMYKTEEEWKKILTPEQYRVMREKDTEAPFTCELKEYKGEGVYHCTACDLPLFKSSAKFESGTGWPSFYEPFAPENLIFKSDDSLGMERTEVLCARCESHLGHVFDDGPPPSGKRFCINGVTLKFRNS